MEKKYTPGPWEKDYGNTIGHIKSTGLDSGDTPTIVHYKAPNGEFELRGNFTNKLYYAGCQGTISKEEQEANANLIAAAPDLLDALEWAVECIKQGFPDQLHSEAVISFDKAVKKAYGETY